jgi:hypothetical protein
MHGMRNPSRGLSRRKRISPEGPQGVNPRSRDSVVRSYPEQHLFLGSARVLLAGLARLVVRAGC